MRPREGYYLQTTKGSDAINKLILIGNLGRDPEMSYLPSGQAVTKFSVASNRPWTDATGQRRESTDWFNCQAWGKLAETCNQYLEKGQQVYIEGRVSLRTFDRRDGGQGASLDVNISNVQFLGKPEAVGAGASGSAPDDLDDLPF